MVGGVPEDWEASWSRHDIDTLLSLCTDDCVLRGRDNRCRQSGKAELEQFAPTVFAATTYGLCHTPHCFATRATVVLQPTVSHFFSECCHLITPYIRPVCFKNDGAVVTFARAIAMHCVQP